MTSLAVTHGRSAPVAQTRATSGIVRKYGPPPGDRHVEAAVADGQHAGRPVERRVAVRAEQGPAGPLAGPDYRIPARLGERRGPNLFHSPAQFAQSLGVPPPDPAA